MRTINYYLQHGVRTRTLTRVIRRIMRMRAILLKRERGYHTRWSDVSFAFRVGR